MNTVMPGPVTIVSGGTYGLGLSISLDLARRGHQVVAFGLAAPQVSSTAKGFEALRDAAKSHSLSDRIEILEADVSIEQDVERVVDHAAKRFGRIDGLVNNAAIGPLGTVLNTTITTLERILAVNVKGPFLTSRMVIPHMIKNGGGSIVNIGSGAGYGKSNMAAYAASKGALFALSTSMAYDHFHDRIRVNVAIPGGGGIISGMSVGRYDGDEDAFKRRGATGAVTGHPVTGEDLANAVAFLLSDQAQAISGTVIDVGCFANQGGPVPARP